MTGFLGRFFYPKYTRILIENAFESMFEIPENDIIRTQSTTPIYIHMLFFCFFSRKSMFMKIGVCHWQTTSMYALLIACLSFGNQCTVCGKTLRKHIYMYGFRIFDGMIREIRHLLSSFILLLVYYFNECQHSPDTGWQWDIYGFCCFSTSPLIVRLTIDISE